MFDELRSARSILGMVTSGGAHNVAVIFLGLYNAAEYLDSLKTQLLSQKAALPILAVDNCSTDDTWSLLQDWDDAFPGQIIRVRNPINLGASGSLYLNEDLIDTPWFITMHQDDFYKPHHISTLLEGLRHATPETICVTTEMGSLSSSGAKQPCPPRASWFLPDNEPATIFTSNLRLHNVPYPAAAFRTDVFFKNSVPWETTACPDTEWVLKVAGLGRFSFIEKETMLYRENPTSESHSLLSEEKSFGSALALLRVFGSASFSELCASIDTPHRATFAQSIRDGIRFRLGESSDLELVSTFASQQMAAVWGYSDVATNEALKESFGSKGALFPTSLLTSINAFYLNETGSADSPSIVITDPGNREKHLLVRVVMCAYGILPVAIRRPLAKVVSKLIRSSNINSRWNFRWK